MKAEEIKDAQAIEIVKAILKHRLPAKRITAHRTVSYLAITLDDNKYRTICRLYLYRDIKHIGLISGRKVETRNRISGVEDIWTYSKELLETVSGYGE